MTVTTPSTIHQHCEAALARFEPDRVAFVADETVFTFERLAAAIERFAAGLRAEGVRPGDVVGYSLPNGPDAIPLFLAISRIGACAVPLFPMIPDAVRTGIFAAMGCSLVIGDGGPTQLPVPSSSSERSAEHAPARFRVLEIGRLQVEAGKGSDPSAAMHPGATGQEVASDSKLLAAATSGTTGASKFVWMTQRNAAAVVSASVELGRIGDWQRCPDFCSMIAFPLSTSGILPVLGLLFAGVRLVFSRDMSPIRYCELAERWKAEALSGPPSYFEYILNLPPHVARPLPAVRAVITGMDFLPASSLKRLSERFPNLDRASSGYGLVETSTVFMTAKAHNRADLAQPLRSYQLCPGAQNEIDVRNERGESVPDGQEGELWVRGASVVSGYVGRPSGLSNPMSSPPSAGLGPFVDGWFRTGDVVRRLDRETVELCGRQKYLIKRGGKSVSPVEVEARIEACPGVMACAVVGVKQPLYGEMVWAFVVPNTAQPPTLKEIMRQCRATLPNYMVPDRVTFIDELPRGSGVGKLNRESLIRKAEAELESI